MAFVIQPSFAKGEIGPALYGRVDTAAYSVACRQANNMIVHAHGGISNRTGLQLICPVKDMGNRPIITEFKFKDVDTYILEFGNLYMRVIRNDGQVLETSKTVSGATQTDPVVITATGHGYSNGDNVFISGVQGMTELNDAWYEVANKTTNTFELNSVYSSGATIDGTGYTTFSGNGSVGKVYEIATPYAQADLDQLKFTQSADTMTIAHPTYEVRELTRADHDDWTLSTATFAPTIDAPEGLVVTVNGADNDVLWKYKVTAIKDETFEESLAAVNNTGLTVSSATATNPVVVSVTGHGLQTGDEVELIDFTEMTEVNDRRFVITKVDANSFSLNGEDGTSYTAESTGGANTCYATFDTSGTVAAPTGTTIPDNTITWTAVNGAIKYAIYRAKGGSGDYGFLAETAELTFTDAETALQLTDLDIQPPTARNPFLLSGKYPGAVGYYQQRRVFGGSTDAPDTSEYSRTGAQSNFSKSRPTQADDAITATLTSNQVNQIRHYVPGKDLVILTDGSEWRVNSGDNSGFAPDTLKQEPQTKWGSSHLKPAQIGQTTLFVQENNISVRTLNYQLNIDGYVGTDLTLLAPHIFDDHTITSWAFTRSPDPVVWVVRSDGRGAAMTFDQEQEVLAWTRLRTLGNFEWCASVRPSANEVDDAAYFVVKRVVGGNDVRFIERIANRRFTELEDGIFVDSSRTYDNPHDVQRTSGSPVVVTEVGDYNYITLYFDNASSDVADGDKVDIEGIQWTPQFDAIGNETNPNQLNGTRYFAMDTSTTSANLVEIGNGLNITGVSRTDPAVVTVTDHGLVAGQFIGIDGVLGLDATPQINGTVLKVGTVLTSDTFEIQTSAGVDVDGTGWSADYTNGGKVYLAADGADFEAYVQAGKVRKAVSSLNGLNHLEGESVSILADGRSVSPTTVSNGAVTLATPASRIHAGLKYISDIETLDIEAPEGTIQGRPVKVSRVVVRRQNSYGMLAGPNKDELIIVKEPDIVSTGEETNLVTGDREIVLRPTWKSNGRVLLRQQDPQPMTILAVIPDIEVGND